MLMHQIAQEKQIYSRGVVCACLEQCVSSHIYLAINWPGFNWCGKENHVSFQSSFIKKMHISLLEFIRPH